MTSRSLALSIVLLLATGGGALAQAPEAGLVVPPEVIIIDGGDLESSPSPAAGVTGPPVPPSLQVTPAPRPRAYEYSDGYRTRLKIHKYASFATVPLFVGQYVVGQKLYDGSGSDSTRSLHGALAATTAALFAVNTVTGVWNLAEGRRDPNGRTKRMVHGILMFVADAGFVATGIMAPEGDERGFESEGGGTSRSTHRTVALASMGVATVAYVMMLIH